MSKRKHHHFDPTKSDSDDETYGAASSPRPRPQGRSSRPKSSGAARKPAKRRRERYGDEEDDIEPDSADASEEEEENSYAGSEAEEAAVSVEKNPKTGRSVRSAAKKSKTYEEPSEDDIEEVSTSDERPVRISDPWGTNSRRLSHIVPTHNGRPLVILRIDPARLKKKMVENTHSSRTRTGSKGIGGGRRESTPIAHDQHRQGGITRRSSRISHDDQDALVALTDSGKHELVTRAGTATPEPENMGGRRAMRGGKGLKKPPSAIFEASQEEDEEVVMERVPIEAAEAERVMGTDIPRSAENVMEGGEDEDIAMEHVDAEEKVVQESMDEDDEEDQGPVIRGGRSSKVRTKASTPPTSQPTSNVRRSMRARKAAGEPSSDFEPDAEGEGEVELNLSDDEDDGRPKPGRGGGSSDGNSRAGRRSGRLNRRKTASQRSRSQRNASDEEADEELDPEEIADEAAELDEDRRRNRPVRRRPAPRTEIAFEPNLRNRANRPDYRILRPELLQTLEEDENAVAATATPQRGRRAGGGGGAYRSLFSTMGPFGGAGGPIPVFGGPDGAAATGGVDSDSSDDEGAAGRGGQQGFGGAVGMTPTSAFPKPFVPQPLNNEPLQGPGGGPPGLGKVKDRKALADADPLGIDPNVSFEGVGGLDEQIDRLKEMVALPLLYPEIFQRFHVTPPRGVLFHGPPGTGKTLLARALASSVSSQGKKVTFYMRKGADALSKWVGEAEKQLRLLFEEARKNQPSIIFFDEIDGLAPVRSSKQEQIHASIVATLLALMDGMDGRGQVIVIGATNRPDSVDPALRRPGRFDREFYFALPDVKARRAILDIHTKGWEPPLLPAFKDQLAEITRGYGGADLRALCTEAALNAVQGTYPQIYASDQKLVIDPSTIRVLAKDFMISVNKIVPSSERSAASGAAALKKDLEPLLREPLQELETRLNDVLPRKRKATALEEAMYDDREDGDGFARETMQREFESARVFRPRLLIHGVQGMGQQYLGAALLSKFEGVHVSNFDMATLLRDSSRSPEAAIVQLFEEVKRHRPSVIFLPNVDVWYETLSESAIRTFTGLLRGLAPTDPVLVLGTMERDLSSTREEDKRDGDVKMVQDIFNYSGLNRYLLERPGQAARYEFFQAVIDLINKAPSEFPEPENRKRRKLAELPVAPVQAAPEKSEAEVKEEQRAQKKKDRQTLNMLKLSIQNVMDQIRTKYKKFRTPVVDEASISYLYDEQNPDLVTTDLDEEQRLAQRLLRPYEMSMDEKGVTGLREVATGKFYYNLESVTIEKRLSNGYYKRFRDFLADVKRLAKDARVSGDQDRTLKANEMLANVEVDIMALEQAWPALVVECEAVFEREQAREAERVAKLKAVGAKVPVMGNVPVPHNVSKTTTTENSGPVVLGQEVPGVRPSLTTGMHPVTPSRVGFGFPPESNMWSTTNGSGSHPLSHGPTTGSEAAGPSRAPQQQQQQVPGEDEEMLDEGSQAVTWHDEALPPTQPPQISSQQQPRSQSNALTRLAPGSQPENYPNSASTTTSGQKTGSGHRSSGPYSGGSHYTNGSRPAAAGAGGGHDRGGRSNPDFSVIAPQLGGSQLPDTMPEESGAGSQASPFFPSQPRDQQQGMLPPPPTPATAARPAATAGVEKRAPSSIDSLLNTTPPSPPPPTTHALITDPQTTAQLHTRLTKSTSGFTVEQLQQISSRLMDIIWKTRGYWNRVVVAVKVTDAFNAAVGDLEECQRIMGPSQGR
ncbi:hypothetical protein LTR62_006106 [Meristemomyces frigidus]|uniref:AAA+ ATPase domain-containing protein n=1 Tax=Meristemomyces frigidus TaxID=1508187 RepID=A0AAN7YEU2_9PEZI|nr:hypothetical protein LTR62_006106 [Meristemomyces frigidus]